MDDRGDRGRAARLLTQLLRDGEGSEKRQRRRSLRRVASGGDSRFPLGGNLFCFLLVFFCFFVNRDTTGKGKGGREFGSGRVAHVLCADVYSSAWKKKRKKKYSNKTRITSNFLCIKSSAFCLPSNPRLRLHT